MKTTPEKLSAIIDNGKAQDEKYISFFEKLIEALKPFEGKTISKRIGTAAAKVFPEYNVWYEDQYGMFHLNFSPKGRTFTANEKITVFLAYDNDKIFTIEKLKQHNPAYLDGARDRNTKREGNLHTTELVAIVINEYLQAKKNLQDSIDSWNYPDYCKILESIGIKSEQLR